MKKIFKIYLMKMHVYESKHASPEIFQPIVSYWKTTCLIDVVPQNDTALFRSTILFTLSKLWKNLRLLKFIYSEKAAKFCEIFP